MTQSRGMRSLKSSPIAGHIGFSCFTVISMYLPFEPFVLMCKQGRPPHSQKFLIQMSCLLKFFRQQQVLHWELLSIWTVV